MKKVVTFLTILTLGLTSCGTQNQVPEQNASDGKLQAQTYNLNLHVLYCDRLAGSPTPSIFPFPYRCATDISRLKSVLITNSSTSGWIKIKSSYGVITDCGYYASSSVTQTCIANYANTADSYGTFRIEFIIDPRYNGSDPKTDYIYVGFSTR